MSNSSITDGTTPANQTSPETTLNTTTVVTTVISTSTTIPTTATSTTVTSTTVQQTTEASGSSVGGIVGGVIGGLFVVALVIGVVVFLYRRKQKHKAQKKDKVLLAPGKDDINKIENTKRLNEYSPPPTNDGNNTDGLYENVTRDGRPNESTDPSVGPDGYLKTVTKQEKEPGNELYYEPDSNADRQGKTKGANEEGYYVNEERRHVYQNKKAGSSKKVHKEKDFDAENYLDLDAQTNTDVIGDEYINPDIVLENENKSQTKSADRHQDQVKINMEVSKDKALKTDTTVNLEVDEEYEVPDPSNYPVPKKPNSKSRTYVNEKKHKKDIKQHHGKEKSRKKGAKEKLKLQKVNSRESKYENVGKDSKCAELGNEAEPVVEEFYEVPVNK